MLKHAKVTVALLLFVAATFLLHRRLEVKTLHYRRLVTNSARATSAKVTSAKVTSTKMTRAKMTSAKMTSAKVTSANMTIAKVTNDKVTRRTAVLLVTQCRSGSSILGELFNRRERVVYLYEPLYPLRSYGCWPMPVEFEARAVRAVEDMVRCEFADLPALYQEAYALTKQPDIGR